MNKFIIYFSILVILLSSVLAITSSLPDGSYVDISFDSGATTQAGDVNVSYIFEPYSNNETKGFFNIVVQTIENVITTIVEGSGNGGNQKSTLYYDVVVDVMKKKYNPNNIVNAKITLINKGHQPDRDAILVTYLVGPDNLNYSMRQEVFELVQPTCLYGNYDLMLDLCVQGNNTYATNKTTLSRQYVLPKDAEFGEWRLYAVYTSYIQPTIVVFDSFRVVQTYFWFILFAAILIYFFYKYEQDSKKLKH